MSEYDDFGFIRDDDEWTPEERLVEISAGRVADFVRQNTGEIIREMLNRTRQGYEQGLLLVGDDTRDGVKLATAEIEDVSSDSVHIYVTDFSSLYSFIDRHFGKEMAPLMLIHTHPLGSSLNYVPSREDLGLWFTTGVEYRTEQSMMGVYVPSSMESGNWDLWLWQTPRDKYVTLKTISIYKEIIGLHARRGITVRDINELGETLREVKELNLRVFPVNRRNPHHTLAHGIRSVGFEFSFYK